MPVARGFDILRQAQTALLDGRPSPARNRLREQALALARDEGMVPGLGRKHRHQPR